MSAPEASGAAAPPEQQQRQQRHHGFPDALYAGNPLAHAWSNVSEAMGPDASALQPGLFRVPKDALYTRANPVPLGLSGFALTTFVLSIVNLEVRGVSIPNVFVAPSLAYGGLIQLLAGMWAMAQGNAFAALALSSYGGFWISIGIIFIPGGFDIANGYGGQNAEFYTALAFFIYAWFIFTVLVWLVTLRSTLLLNMLLLTVWLAFLMLATGYLDNSGGANAKPNPTLNKAGGGFGIIASFIAWILLLEGVATKNNSFVVLPPLRFPWSPETRVRKGKPEAVGLLKTNAPSSSNSDRDVEKQD